ncbi:MAG: hypothetical protein ACKO38_00655 [Planctomycetota bacterium]
MAAWAKWTMIAAVVVAGGWGGTESCFADNVWSQSRDSKRAGLRWEISGSGAYGAGYLPIEVLLETLSGAASPNDRRIQFELELQRGRASDLFSREIVLPSGATRVTATIPITLGKASSWQQAIVRCSEDGRAIPELSGPLSTSYPNQLPFTELFPSLLFIDRDAPAVDQRQAMINSLLSLKEPVPAVLPRFLPLTARLSGIGGANLGLDANNTNNAGPGKPNNNRTGTSLATLAASQTTPTSINDADTLLSLGNLENVGLVSPAELPKSWLHLSNYDVIFIPWTDLRDLAQTATDQFAALRTWVSAGGVLCVHGVGERFVGQRSLEATLKLTRGHVASTSKAGAPPKAAEAQDASASSGNSPPVPDTSSSWTYSSEWRELNRQRQPNFIPLYQDQEGYELGEFKKSSPQWNDESSKMPQPISKSEGPLFNARIRDLGLGLVVALDTLDPWEAKPSSWGQLFNFVGESRFRPLQRLGLSRLSENPDFGSFVIPGVGRPPIVLFLCLITAFAILLGPVNYYVLRARRRLHWMFVTVPAAAFIATSGLLGYAVLADGLGVRMRVLSVTHVDQLAEVTSSLSRQTYFAGMSPRGGIQFPVESLVHPIERRNSRFNDERQQSLREVVWADRQAYTSGYVSPRTMTQWLVVAPQASTIGVRIQMAADGSGACRVRNELGVGLHALAICDEQGRHYFAKGLESGEEAKLEAQDWKDISREWLAAIPPRPPVTGGWDIPQRNRWMMWQWQQFQTGNFATSPLNAYQQKVLGTQPFNCRRGYLALAEQPVATPFGATPDEIVHDLHIVIGVW